MAKSIWLSCDHGSALLKAAFFTVWPEKVGEKEFSRDQCASIMGEFEELGKLLKKQSPLACGPNKDRQFLFGPAEAYRKVSKSDEEIRREADEAKLPVSMIPKYAWEIVAEKEQATFEVPTRTVHRRAIYRLLYLWLNPKSKTFLNALQRTEFLWPLAEQLGADVVKQLRKDTGMEEKATWDVPVGEDESEEEQPKLTAT